MFLKAKSVGASENINEKLYTPTHMFSLISAHHTTFRLKLDETVLRVHMK